MLVDTGADISVIKNYAIDQNSFCYPDQKCTVTGVGPEPIQTKALLPSKILIDKNIDFECNLQIVSDTFPINCDGILGNDFLSTFSCIVDYGSRTLSIPVSNANIIIDSIKFPKLLAIPARSEKITRISVNVSNGEELLCTSKEIISGVFVSNSLVKAVENSVTISLINTNEFSVEVDVAKFEFEKIDQYDIFNLNNSWSDGISSRLKNLQSKLKLDHLNDEELNSILSICRDHNDIFHLDGDILTATTSTTHKIPTQSDCQPIYRKSYRLPEAMKEEINRQVNDMLKNDIIESSDSPWNFPLLVVPKKSEGTKKWRVVVDFRRLNDITLDRVYPLPNINEILDQLGNAMYFSTVDLANGYHQVYLDEQDKIKTAFNTNFGHYQFKRMPFGLKGAPATFQHLMNSALSGLNGSKVFIYLDDVVIYGRNLVEHNDKLREVFTCLRKHNLKLNPEKCQFLKKELYYLGHMITQNGVKPDPNKIAVIKAYPIPRTAKEIKSFMGLIGYYRRFIRDFSKISQPLTNLLKKDIPFIWSPFCDEAFVTLKTCIIEPPILKYPDFTKEFTITCDASDIAIGSVLSQTHISGDMPVAFASRVLNKAEKSYSTSEKELLAMVWSVNHFRPYVYGRFFTIVTDHKPLIWLCKNENPSSRLLRWRIKLEEYNFKIIHKAGALNTNADALSRVEITEQDIETQNSDEFINIVTRSKSKLLKQQNQENSKSFISENHSTKSYNSETPESRKSDHFNSEPHNSEPLESTFSKSQARKSETLDCCNSEPHKTNLDSESFKPKSCNSDSLMQNLIIPRTVTFKSNPNNSLKRVSLPIPESEDKTSSQSIQNPNSDDTVENDIDNKIPQQPELVSDTTEQQRIIRDFHISSIGGHQGIVRTFKRIRQYYYFPRMFSQIEKFIKSCEHCQKNKSGRENKLPMEITPTSKTPFNRIALDIVGPFLSTYNNNTCILTMQDDLTKYSIAVALPNSKAETIAEAFVNHFVCIYGTPYAILTDQGSDFLSHFFKKCCKLLKIEKINTTAYHPQSNGALERSHKPLVEYLKIFAQTDTLNWDSWLNYCMFAYNTTPHTTTTYMPYELIFGRKPKLPHVFTTDPELSYNYHDYLSDLKYQMQVSFQIAREKCSQSKIKSKQYYDKNSKSVTFKIDDQVWLKNQNKKGKLTAPWLGPYVIKRIISAVNSELLIGKSTRVVHNNRLKLKT